MLINDPIILQVEVEECGEKMVPVSGPGFYLPSQISTDIGIGDGEIAVRESVRGMLFRMMGMLPEGFGAVLIQGYREYELQKELWEKSISKFGSEQRAQKFVSNPNKFSPHLTGGAIDLGIVNEKRELLDFGNVFEHNHLAPLGCRGLSRSQKENRKLLESVMTRSGFVNYPTEWWHWSYGDKYWGYLTRSKAIYDTVKI